MTTEFIATMQWPVPGVPYAYNRVDVHAGTLEEFRNAIQGVNGTAETIFLASETMRAAHVDGGNGAAHPTPPATNTVPQAVPQPAPSGPATGVPQCAHGARNHVTGSTNGKPWEAYFCALPKGTPGSCDPHFVDTK